MLYLVDGVYVAVECVDEKVSDIDYDTRDLSELVPQVDFLNSEVVLSDVA